MKRYRGRPARQIPSVVNGWQVKDRDRNLRYPLICLNCGKKSEANPRALYNKTLRLCECSRVANDDLYKKWRSLRAQVKHDSYYQSRGVEIEFRSFSEFKEELGKPTGNQIRRIDTTENFRPGNVIWS